MSFSSLRRPEAGIDRLKIGRLDRDKTPYRQSLVAPRSMVAGCVLMVAEVLHRFHSLCLHRGCPFGVFRACSAFFMSLGGVVVVCGGLLSVCTGSHFCRMPMAPMRSFQFTSLIPVRTRTTGSVSISKTRCRSQGGCGLGVSVGPASGDDRLRRGVYVNNFCHCRTGRACPICVADSTRHWQLYREVAAAVESEARGPYEIPRKF